MSDKPYILSNVESLDSASIHSMHQSLIARLCAVKWLKKGERMILSFDIGELRTSIVEDVVMTDDNLLVTTTSNLYTFTPCMQ